MRGFLVVTIVAALSGGAVFAESQTQSICEAAKKTPLPAEAGQLSRVDTSGGSAACDAKALYYGYQGAPDYRAALACGYRQRAHPDPNGMDPFAGPGVLTMLYANGQGVARNYGLALRFACEIDGASDAETEGRVEHLVALRDGKQKAAAPFDLCDDTTSGFMMGACTQIAQKKKDSGRGAGLDELKAALPAAAQALFPKLAAAEHAFEQTRMANEIDLSGSGRASFQLEDQGKLRDQFLLNLRNFAKGVAPRVAAEQATQAQKAEQAAYQATQAAPKSTWQYGTVKPAGIAATETAWRALRAEWLQFAAKAYSGLAPGAVATELDRLRTHQLRSLLPRS